MVEYDLPVEETVEAQTNIFAILGGIVYGGLFIILRTQTAAVSIGVVPVFLKTVFEVVKKQTIITKVASLSFFAISILLMFLGGFLIYNRYIATKEFPTAPLVILLIGLFLASGLIIYNPNALVLYVVSGILAPIFEELATAALAIFITKQAIGEEKTDLNKILGSPIFYIVVVFFALFFAGLHIGVYGLEFISALYGAFMFRLGSILLILFTKSVFSSMIAHSLFNIFLLSVTLNIVSLAPLVAAPI